MFEEQKKEAEAILKSEKLACITNEIVKRMKKIEQMEAELLVLKKEVNALVDTGELKNIDDYVKVSAIDNTSFTTPFTITNSDINISRV